MTSLAPTIQAFFTDGLMRQRHASPHTVAAYRDTFCLLFSYLADATGKTPARLDWTDIDAVTVGEFLITSKPSGATACGPATRAAAPSTPSLTSRPSATLSTPT